MKRTSLTKKLQSGYHAMSIIVTNTGLLFLLLNIMLFVPAAMRDADVRFAQDRDHASRTQARPGQPKLTAKRNGYQMHWSDLRSYENTDPSHVDQVLDDFYELSQRGYAFHPYTHFTEPSFSSSTLNLAGGPDGFITRVTPRDKPAKYPHEVFVFGGSTTFGWHVGDRETIPYHLEADLNKRLRSQRVWKQVQVTNHGKGYHSWFQEMVLFERLLHAGRVPKVAVFIDGVNVLHANSPHEVPYWNDKMTELWDQAQVTTSSLPGVFPLFRVVNYFKRRHLNQWVQDFTEDRHPSYRTYSLPDWIIKTRDSYLNTIDQIDALAKSYGVKTLFVWQPNRAYDCQTGKYSQPLPSHYVNKMVPLYAEMRSVKRGNFHFMGDLCRRFGSSRRVIVDDVHYSPEFNRYVASRIASVVPIN